MGKRGPGLLSHRSVTASAGAPGRADRRPAPDSDTTTSRIHRLGIRTGELGRNQPAAMSSTRVSAAP